MPTAVERSRLVYRWDLDKTYLRTDFDTLRQLLARAIERASDKRTIPGAAALLREIRDHAPAGIYILSGSPEQMRRVLEAKLRLDGVHWDGFTLKPSLKNLLRGHFSFLRDQVGFKLGAMLASREPLSSDLDEILFGDDAETDVFTYSLYADICAGRVSSDQLRRVLAQAGVLPEEIAVILARAARLPKRDCCHRIFIHLERISPLDTFEAYGSRVCPFYNYFQPAAVLVERDALDPRAALRVAAELVVDQGFTPEALLASFVELSRRGQVGQRSGELLATALREAKPNEYATATGTLVELGQELEMLRVPPVPEPGEPLDLDYDSLLARERERARTAKLRVLSRR